jgi:molybdenum cofactor cytidylyltransferase
MPNPSQTPSGPRLFAVVPAAGRSRRMGRPKLLLPLGGKTVVARLLAALDHPAVAGRFVVVRADDAELRAAVEAAGGAPVVPTDDPLDMRASVEHALAAIAARCRPEEFDGWLLVPADHPVLEPEAVAAVIAAWRAATAAGARDVIVPTHGNRRGHPTAFPWPLAERVAGMPADQGLNWLLRHGGVSVRELPVDTPAILTDLDTPTDYARLQARFAADEG